MQQRPVNMASGRQYESSSRDRTLRRLLPPKLLPWSSLWSAVALCGRPPLGCSVPRSRLPPVGLRRSALLIHWRLILGGAVLGGSSCRSDADSQPISCREGRQLCWRCDLEQAREKSKQARALEPCSPDSSRHKQL